MKGCDNFCSYCVVPYTRGREHSRPADEIVEEVRRVKESGTKDITLIGQNVNSYHHRGTNFCALLRMVNRIAGSVRIRFITSHPRDFGRDLVETVAECESICEHIHLPLQSGSTRILQSMNRGYTFEEYLGKVETTRSLVQGVAFSTDLLVGFPGETEQDFLLTLSAVDKIGFDFAYMFAYSRREGTKASTLEHEVPHHVKQDRLRELISRQNRITAEKNRALVSTITEVLVEGNSSKNPEERVGRTRTNKSVVFRGVAGLGDLALVEVEELRGWTPYGRVLESRGKGAADVRHL
jgi:tRNA-2-methylthio-N6-dimethylallyladenosine synthase